MLAVIPWQANSLAADKVTMATRPSSSGTITTILGLLSMAAALIHFAVIEQHLAEYWLYGAFFIVVGLAQLAWALAISAAPTRWLMTGGVIGNALVVITWIVTRTVGSLVGPAASTPAKVGFGDVVATVLQVLIVGGGIGWLSGRLAARGGGWVEHARVIAALVVLQPGCPCLVGPGARGRIDDAAPSGRRMQRRHDERAFARSADHRHWGNDAGSYGDPRYGQRHALRSRRVAAHCPGRSGVAAVG